MRCNNTPLNDIPKNKYSVVFIDFGINPETYEDLSQIKALFIVTDCNKQHTIPLSIWLNNQTARPVSIRIIRDIVSGKIRPRYIDSLLQAGQKTQMIAKYDFPINEIDYSSRLLSQYDDVFPFAKFQKNSKVCYLTVSPRYLKRIEMQLLKQLGKAQIGG